MVVGMAVTRAMQDHITDDVQPSQPVRYGWLWITAGLAVAIAVVIILCSAVTV